MHRIPRVLLLASTMLFASARADAVTLFSARLTGSQEVPPNASTATGLATFVLNDAQTALTVSVIVFGLDFTGLQTPGNPNDDLQNAHIHCCAPAGTNASVRWGFIGTPFNNTDNDGVTTPFTNGVGGTFTGEWDANEGNGGTLATFLPGILAGQAYINFHTVAFTGGEIRGQILIPEPPAIVLLALGVLMLGYMFRRQVDG